MATQIILLAIIMWYLALLIEGIHSHGIINAGGNPFDVGPQNQCESANVVNGSICSDVVNYDVPTPIARLSKIIETVVNDSLQEGVVERCWDSYRRVLCLHRFPRCQSNRFNNRLSVTLNERTYTAALIQNCGIYANRIFINERVFALSDDCFPFSAFLSFELMRCQVNADNRLSPWMLEYLKEVDRTITQETGFLYSLPVCGKKYALHKCNFIGRCTSKGHVELINSYESCRNATTCYNNQLQPFAEHGAHCDQWPHIAMYHRVKQRGVKLGIIESARKMANSAQGLFAELPTELLGIAMSQAYAIMTMYLF